MHPAIKLRHIRAFLAIAASGNLSAVARAQGLTQPALSRSLGELETLLGQPLFLRQGRRLSLTDAGELFRRHAAIAVRTLEAGADALEPAKGAGTISIGVLPSAATRLFPLAGLRFAALYPHVTLALETGPHFYLVNELRRGKIDLMVGRMPAASEMDDLAFDHLYEEEVLLVARRDHPMLSRPLPEILRQVPLVLPPATALIRRSVDEYLTTMGVAGRRAVFETAALAIGRGIVLASEAVWFISRGVVAHELETGELVRLPVEARALFGAVGITWRQAAGMRPDIDLLMQITRDVARQTMLA